MNVYLILKAFNKKIKEFMLSIKLNQQWLSLKKNSKIELFKLQELFKLFKEVKGKKSVRQ